MPSNSAPTPRVNPGGSVNVGGANYSGNAVVPGTGGQTASQYAAGSGAASRPSSSPAGSFSGTVQTPYGTQTFVGGRNVGGVSGGNAYSNLSPGQTANVTTPTSQVQITPSSISTISSQPAQQLAPVKANSMVNAPNFQLATGEQVYVPNPQTSQTNPSNFQLRTGEQVYIPEQTFSKPFSASVLYSGPATAPYNTRQWVEPSIGSQLGFGTKSINVNQSPSIGTTGNQLIDSITTSYNAPAKAFIGTSYSLNRDNFGWWNQPANSKVSVITTNFNLASAASNPLGFAVNPFGTKWNKTYDIDVTKTPSQIAYTADIKAGVPSEIAGGTLKYQQDILSTRAANAANLNIQSRINTGELGYTSPSDITSTNALWQSAYAQNYASISGPLASAQAARGEKLFSPMGIAPLVQTAGIIGGSILLSSESIVGSQIATYGVGTIGAYMSVKGAETGYRGVTEPGLNLGQRALYLGVGATETGLGIAGMNYAFGGPLSIRVRGDIAELNAEPGMGIQMSKQNIELARPEMKTITFDKGDIAGAPYSISTKSGELAVLREGTFNYAAPVKGLGGWEAGVKSIDISQIQTIGFSPGANAFVNQVVRPRTSYEFGLGTRTVSTEGFIPRQVSQSGIGQFRYNKLLFTSVGEQAFTSTGMSIVSRSGVIGVNYPVSEFTQGLRPYYIVNRNIVTQPTIYEGNIVSVKKVGTAKEDFFSGTNFFKTNVDVSKGPLVTTEFGEARFFNYPKTTNIYESPSSTIPMETIQTTNIAGRPFIGRSSSISFESLINANQELRQSVGDSTIKLIGGKVTIYGPSDVFTFGPNTGVIKSDRTFVLTGNQLSEIQQLALERNAIQSSARFYTGPQQMQQFGKGVSETMYSLGTAGTTTRSQLIGLQGDIASSSSLLLTPETIGATVAVASPISSSSLVSPTLIGTSILSNVASQRLVSPQARVLVASASVVPQKMQLVVSTIPMTRTTAFNAINPTTITTTIQQPMFSQILTPSITPSFGGGNIGGGLSPSLSPGTPGIGSWWLPTIDFDLGGRKGRKGRTGRKKIPYTPSYDAFIFNIRSKRKPRGTETGIRTRPITKGWKWWYGGGF